MQRMFYYNVKCRLLKTETDTFFTTHITSNKYFKKVHPIHALYCITKPHDLNLPNGTDVYLFYFFHILSGVIMSLLRVE